MADIGKEVREVEFEPLTQPVSVPEPAPAEPQREPEKVPAGSSGGALSPDAPGRALVARLTASQGVRGVGHRTEGEWPAERHWAVPA
jgi:hypothetical protein